MPQLTIRHADGSTDTIAQTTKSEVKRELGKMRRGKFYVERSLAQNANLEPKSDVIELPNDDNLRLVDLQTGGSTWLLKGYSFEWDANQASPTVGGDTRSGSDDTIISNFVGSVSSWSAGTINQFAPSVEFVFSHAQPHEAIRKVEKNTKGELQFRDEGVVDYVDRLGTDRSGSVELSASAGTIEDEITITERGRKLDGTHIRVLGAHEGEAQLFANLVPQDDPQTYENEVRYSTSRWSDSSDTEWNRWSNKDVTDQTTIEEEAAELGEELKESLVEAKATVSDVDLNVGDTVQVVKSDANLNRTMRIHRLKEIVDGATEKAKVLLSTRTTLRTDAGDDLKDIQRFNTGFQGSSVAITGGPVIQAIDSSNDVTIPFRYPDLEFENAAELQVQGLEYRVDAKPKSHDHVIPELQIESTQSTAEAGGATTIQTNDSSVDRKSATQDVWNDMVTIDAGFSDSEGADVYYSMTMTRKDFPDTDTNFDVNTVDVRVQDDSGTEYPQASGITQSVTQPALDIDADGQSETWADVDIEGSIKIPENTDDRDYTVQLKPDVEDYAVDVYATIVVYDEHAHSIGGSTIASSTTETAAGLEAGIFGTNDTPSNVDVLVNGSTVATNIGSGTFQTTIDIGGELNVDQWNTITLTSDSLGRIQATPFVEGYDQIGQQ